MTFPHEKNAVHQTVEQTKLSHYHAAIDFRELLIIGGVAARDQLSVLDNGVSCIFNLGINSVLLIKVKRG